MRSCRWLNRTACASNDGRETSAFRGSGRSTGSLKSPRQFFRRHRRRCAGRQWSSLKRTKEGWARPVRFQLLDKRQQPPQPLEILPIMNLLLHASLKRRRGFGISDFGFGAKLAAIEAIVRDFPGSPWIDRQMTGRAAHFGLPSFQFDNVSCHLLVPSSRPLNAHD